MDTQFSLRAQQLKDIYRSITMEGVSRDERLDILLTLKCTVKVSQGRCYDNVFHCKCHYSGVGTGGAAQANA